jgi:glycosyltransferase involved in cell wall biosynthesis
MKIEVAEARRRLRAMNASLPMCVHFTSGAHEGDAMRMLRAWAGVRPIHRRGWTLTIVGVGTTQSASLAAAARQFAVSPSVRLMPTVSREDASVLISASDAMVCPDGEGQPDPYTFDAMLRGKPTLVGDRPAAREALDDAVWFIDPEDTAAISRCLSRLLNDGLLRRELGQSAALRAASLGETRRAVTKADVASGLDVARAA